MPNNDNNVVHRFTDETISGVKTFASGITINSSGTDDPVYSGTIRSTENGIRFSSEAFGTSESGAVLDLNGRSTSSDKGVFYLRAISDTDTKTFVGRPSGTLTWGGKDITGDVHTTGDETIDGEKTFTGNNWVYNTGPSVMLRNKNWSHTAAPSANRYSQFSVHSEDNKREGRLLFYKNTDGATGITLEIVRNNATTTAGFGIGVNASGLHWANVGSNVTQFAPDTTNKTTLGTSSRRWKEIWCNQSSINTSSDERMIPVAPSVFL